MSSVGTVGSGDTFRETAKNLLLPSPVAELAGQNSAKFQAPNFVCKSGLMCELQLSPVVSGKSMVLSAALQ
jgi:hypothetical protein